MTSELALGTWGLSGEAYGPVDEPDAEAVIARCLLYTSDAADE